SEDPIDYPADRGDDDDDDDESSDDDEDDDDDVEEDEDEEGEEDHPALVDSVPPPVHCITARTSIQDEPPTPFWSESSPLPHIPSPPLPVSSPVLVLPPPLLASPTYPLGYRATMIWQRAETPSTSHPLSLSTPSLLPIPLPTPSPPLLLPSTDCRAGVFEVTLPPQKRLCIALSPRYEVSESSSAPTSRPTGGFRADYSFVTTLDDEIRRDPKRDVGYGITDTWDEMLVGMPREPATDDTESLMSGWLNMLFKDRRAHAHTSLLREREAIFSREAWGQSMNASDTARSEAQLVETLRLMSTLQTQKKMAPKRTTKANPTTTTATTFVTNAQLKEMIDQGVTNALAAHDGDRNTNGDDNHNSGALTWWNSHIRTVGYDVTYAMTWTDLKKKMTDKYCPRGEIKKLEAELIFPKESDKIERYVSGLPNMIYGIVVASRPKTMQEAIEIATELMDKKIHTFVERSGEKEPYGGSKPLCRKCNYIYDGPCAPKCHKCNRVGHLARDCRSTANANTANNQRGTGAGQKPTCYECGA
ncbi:putative reverse transcriptase domain-containing protein, partial [Tanacetum coccineum]